MKVGFIGIGQMGVHMAGNIQAAGNELVVHDAKKEAADPLLATGARWAESPKDVAEACRLVISCLPTPQIVEEVALGPDGLQAAWKAGRHLHRHEHQLPLDGQAHRRGCGARKACACSTHR